MPFARHLFPSHTMGPHCVALQGNITAWKLKVGDEVAPGTVIAEVETDKATLDWEAQVWTCGVWSRCCFEGRREATNVGEGDGKERQRRCVGRRW
eukprot:354837-Chlamydomonas_euryale.AAC.4